MLHPIAVKFERHKDGEVAILPRADYERLAKLASEDAEDAGTPRSMRRTRKVPLIPAEFSDRLARGESPIRVHARHARPQPSRPRR
jgi:hypothetical protein